MLGRLRYSVPEASRVYGRLAQDVFSDRKRTVKDGMFKATKMEKAIKGVVESRLGVKHVEERMLEEQQDGLSCKTLISFLMSSYLLTF